MNWSLRIGQTTFLCPPRRTTNEIVKMNRLFTLWADDFFVYPFLSELPPKSGTGYDSFDFSDKND